MAKTESCRLVALAAAALGLFACSQGGNPGADGTGGTDGSEPPNELLCDYAEPSCGETAAADWVVEEVDSVGAIRTFDSYDNEACSNQVVVELDPQTLGLQEVFLFRQFAKGTVADEASCTESRLHVTVLRESPSGWSEFDRFTVGHQWNGLGCDSLGAGKLGPDRKNTNLAYPFSWIDMGGETSRVRVVLSGEVSCEERSIEVVFLRSL